MNVRTLTDKDRKEIVRYRIEKADRTYKEAIAVIDSGFVNAAANRLYYSAYYAVSALLIAIGVTARTHDGVRRMFGLHFIKTQLVPKQYLETFVRLLSLRMTGDYEDRKNLDMELDVKPLVKPAKELIEVVTKMAMEKMQDI